MLSIFFDEGQKRPTTKERLSAIDKAREQGGSAAVVTQIVSVLNDSDEGAEVCDYTWIGLFMKLQNLGYDTKQASVAFNPHDRDAVDQFLIGCVMSDLLTYGGIEPKTSALLTVMCSEEDPACWTEALEKYCCKPGRVLRQSLKGLNPAL